MSKGMLHIRDVEGPKKTGSVETRLEAMEQQVFKCQGMVERGLNANHMMITKFTSNHKMDAIDIGKHLSRLYDRFDQLQGHIYDLQNQYCEYEYRLKSIRRFRSRIQSTSNAIASPTSTMGFFLSDDLLRHDFFLHFPDFLSGRLGFLVQWVSTSNLPLPR
ncbi:40S ribosomal protein S5-1 [Hordeum vulgare]|nr:40S ribosomal protein S5-1 [Hordeum vulgare]